MNRIENTSEAGTVRKRLNERWSEAELALLRQMAAENASAATIAIKLNRSIETVRKKALMEGIKFGTAT